MNLNTLEKVAREILSGKGANTVKLTSAERRAVNSTTWQITPGSTTAGTWALVRPNSWWG